MKIFRLTKEAGRVEIPTGKTQRDPAAVEVEDIETFTHRLVLPNGTIIWADPSEPSGSEDYLKNRRPLWGIQKPGESHLQSCGIGAPPQGWDPTKAEVLNPPRVFRSVNWNDVS